MTALPPALTPAVLGGAAVLDLSDNTNLYGTPPAALRVLREGACDGIAGYPSPQADNLRAALARHLATPMECVTTGCGSDDVLDSTIRAMAQPGERIAFPDPTFSMIPMLARRNRLEAAPVPLTAGFDIDAPGLLATGARIIYLCSPNNPTGTAASRGAVEQVLDRASGVVLLDEAYAEFAGTDFLAESARRPNLLIVRTLSKAFGLAGLRVGYGVGEAALMARVEEARGPYKVGTLAERAAAAVLDEDLAWMRERAGEAVRDRGRLLSGLSAMGLSPLTSAANFVLVPVPDAAACEERMRRSRILVRAFRTLTGIGDALRITVGPAPTIERALAALKEALA